jgi:hypothetical protein
MRIAKRNVTPRGSRSQRLVMECRKGWMDCGLLLRQVGRGCAQAPVCF